MKTYEFPELTVTVDDDSVFINGVEAEYFHPRTSRRIHKFSHNGKTYLIKFDFFGSYFEPRGSSFEFQSSEEYYVYHNLIDDEDKKYFAGILCGRISTPGEYGFIIQEYKEFSEDTFTEEHVDTFKRICNKYQLGDFDVKVGQGHVHNAAIVDGELMIYDWGYRGWGLKGSPTERGLTKFQTVLHFLYGNQRFSRQPQTSCGSR